MLVAAGEMHAQRAVRRASLNRLPGDAGSARHDRAVAAHGIADEPRSVGVQQAREESIGARTQPRQLFENEELVE